MAEQAGDTIAALDLPLPSWDFDDIRDRAVAYILFATIAPLCPILKCSVLCLRPIGLNHHLMEGQGELTHVAMLSQPEEAAELIEQAAAKVGIQ